MTTIDPRQPLAAALQQQLQALRKRGTATSGTAPPGAATAAGSTGALGAGVLQRIRALDAADPDRRRKAVRLYLEGELARTFGPALLNDPALPTLLDAVQQQMQQDAPTAAAVHALGELLLAGKLA